MLWGLLRYLDPIEHRKRQEDLRRQREDWPPEIDPSEADDADLARPVVPPTARAYRCRICSHVGPERLFCPVCLAETMR